MFFEKFAARIASFCIEMSVGIFLSLVISLVSLLLNDPRWQCISQKTKIAVINSNRGSDFFSFLSDSALSLCRIFLVKHVEMHNLFELILEIEDRAVSTGNAGSSCILSLHSVGLYLQ